jgi:hypothetical protein
MQSSFFGGISCTDERCLAGSRDAKLSVLTARHGITAPNMGTGIPACGARALPARIWLPLTVPAAAARTRRAAGVLGPNTRPAVPARTLDGRRSCLPAAALLKTGDRAVKNGIKALF